jgi:hypothetical protein
VDLQSWQPQSRGFVILLRNLVRLLWTSDQPVAKASTYTGQHNTETQRQTSSGIRTYGPSNQADKTYALDRAATGIDGETLYRWLKLP